MGVSWRQAGSKARAGEDQPQIVSTSKPTRFLDHSICIALVPSLAPAYLNIRISGLFFFQLPLISLLTHSPFLRMWILMSVLAHPVLLLSVTALSVWIPSSKGIFWSVHPVTPSSTEPDKPAAAAEGIMSQGIQTSHGMQTCPSADWLWREQQAWARATCCMETRNVLHTKSLQPRLPGPCTISHQQKDC